ncbi:YceI family protein [Streptomyces sp. AC627_RSS907]|uniref:YceI family protein n=1 Tax=Streptomyces sp. AC627_RSS907 TaxID=2823684 RepID=UPI0020B7C9D3|nr:YceI family protein [Streptomyces sp. AC627_RSS907]
MSVQHAHAVSADPGPYAGVAGAHTIDPVHSTVGFTARHAVISDVRGRFERDLRIKVAPAA